MILFYSNVVCAFLVSMLLWHLTWGWTQIIINFFLTWFFLMVVSRKRLIQSAFLSLLSHVVVSLFLGLCIGGVLVYFLDYQFEDTNRYMVIYEKKSLLALQFAALYGALQYLFFLIYSRVFYFQLTHILCVVILSNVISAFIVPFFITFT